MESTGKLLALFMLLAMFATGAHAGLLRYDMSYLSINSAGSPDFSGYMLFDDATPLDGNIWPGIVDWRFDVGGFIFDTGNTNAATDGYFEVDSQGIFRRDFLLTNQPPGIEFLTPCFSSTASCSGDGTYIGFQSFVAGTFVQFPGATFPSTTLGGSILYLAPVRIPLGGTLLLVLTGLTGILGATTKR